MNAFKTGILILTVVFFSYNQLFSQSYFNKIKEDFDEEYVDQMINIISSWPNDTLQFYFNKSSFNALVDKKFYTMLHGDIDRNFFDRNIDFIIITRELQNRDIDMPDMYLYLASLLKNLKYYSESIFYATKALSHKNDNNIMDESAIYATRGESKFLNEDYYGAIEDLTRTINLQKEEENKFDEYTQRGLSLFFISNFDKAINDFNKAISIDPAEPVTYYYLGLTYLSKNDIKNACINLSNASNYGMDVKNDINKYCH